MILGANHEAESVPIIGHPVSAILGAKHEAESVPIIVDIGYLPILAPENWEYRKKIDSPAMESTAHGGLRKSIA